MTWALAYVGKPWSAGAAGPDAFDCWGLVRVVQAAHFGRELPPVAVDAADLRDGMRAFRDAPERARWVPVDWPMEGDCVLLSHGRHPHHVGVWVAADGGGVLHAVEGAGVIFSSHQALQRTGWRVVGYFRFSP